jgi:hypothetical protein
VFSVVVFLLDFASTIGKQDRLNGLALNSFKTLIRLPDQHASLVALGRPEVVTLQAPPFSLSTADVLDVLSILSQHSVDCSLWNCESGSRRSTKRIEAKKSTKLFLFSDFFAENLAQKLNHSPQPNHFAITLIFVALMS